MHITKIITFLKSRWWNIRASEMGYFCIWTIRSIYIYWSTIAYLPSMYSRLKNGIEASVANGRRKQLVLKHFKYNTTTYFYTLFEVSKTLNCFSIDQKRTPSILNNLVTSKKTFCLLFQCTFAQQM